MELQNLTEGIKVINDALRESAVKTINTHITIRNWLIGYCIVNYELHGEDRAKYGDKILEKLAERLNEDGLSYRNLRLFRQFYVAFSEFTETIFTILNKDVEIWQTLCAKSQFLSCNVAVATQQLPKTLPDSIHNKPAVFYYLFCKNF